MALRLQVHTLSDWKRWWRDGEATWHQTAVNSFLKKHFHALLERTVCGEDKTKGDQHSPSSIRILVPLCGKTVDMMWLAEAGHEVVGVEFTELPVKEFFTENNLPSEHEQVGKLVRYKSTDVSRKVELWHGDIFECSRYVDLILSLLVPKGSILLTSFDYNQKERLVAPFSIPGPMLQQLWGLTCSLELLETRDLLKESAERFHKAWALSRLDEVVYIIQKMS